MEVFDGRFKNASENISFEMLKMELDSENEVTIFAYIFLV